MGVGRDRRDDLVVADAREGPAVRLGESRGESQRDAHDALAGVAARLRREEERRWCVVGVHRS